MGTSRPPSGRIRWLKNLGLYVLVVSGFVLTIGIFGAVTKGVSDPAGAIAGWIFGTFWLGTAGLFALAPFLVVVELFLRRGQRRRLAAVVLGAVIPTAGLVLSQVGHPISVTPESLLVILGIALPGAIFGALAQLPPIAPPRVTLADAD